MTQRNDGGPAFPIAAPMPTVNGKGERTGEWVWCDEGIDEGMTLRDYFAAKAMQGILAYPGDGTNGSAHNNSTPAEVALMAYEYADWMLAKREN